MKKSIYIILEIMAISCLGCRERRNESHEKFEPAQACDIYFE